MDYFLRPPGLPDDSSNVVYHSSAARSIYPGESQSRTTSLQSQASQSQSKSSSIIEPLLLDNPADDELVPSHLYPSDSVHVVRGIEFEVDFKRVFCSNVRLESTRLGYAVRHKSQLKGGRGLSPIWKYGVELAYVEDDRSSLRLWLCRLCHVNQIQNDAKKVNTYRHIYNHMRKAHKIDPATGKAITITPPYSPSFEAAARVPGSSSILSKTPWQEGAFLNAFVDWIIQNDVSFL